MKDYWDDDDYDDESDGMFPGGSISDEDLEKKNDRTVEVMNIMQRGSSSYAEDGQIDLLTSIEEGHGEDETSQASSSLPSQKEEKPKQLPPFDFSNLPEHSCAYCGIHDTRSVV